MSMNVKSTGIVIALLFSCLYVFSSAVYATEDNVNVKNKSIHWPLPPAKARFAYVKSVYGESRQQGGGIFSGLKRFLFGDDIPNHFSRPHDIAVSDTGLMVVTDPGAAGFHILNTENDEYHFIQQLDETRLVSPIGAAFTDEDEILITDSLAKAIYRVSSEGEKLGQITDKALQRPTDIAVHPLTHDIYVLDTLGHNIHVYDSSGKKRFQFGKRGNQPGEFNFPTHLTFSRKGELYVTDTMNFRVQVFDQKNQPMAHFGSLGDRLGEFSKPKGIALDEQDNVYIVDSHFDHLLVYDKKGRFLLPIGGNGTGPGLFNLPTGVTISQHYIYIIDSYNRRVQILKRLG